MGARSIIRPRTNGPRSITRHVIDFSPMLTRSVDPNGWRLCAHVIACGLNASPLAVRRPLYAYGYNEATPASAAIDSLIAGSPRTSAASAKDRRDIMCPRTRTSYPHANHATARYSCEKMARIGRAYGSNWSGGSSPRRHLRMQIGVAGASVEAPALA